MKFIVEVYNQRIVQEHSNVTPITVGVLAVFYGIRLYMALYHRSSASVRGYRYVQQEDGWS
jgi:steroid 5-alpha reductase family enzyme